MHQDFFDMSKLKKVEVVGVINLLLSSSEASCTLQNIRIDPCKLVFRRVKI
jgi:hypothetical protein